jgi:hypothetical protein
MKNRNSRLKEKTFEYDQVPNRNLHDISNQMNNMIDQNESKRDGEVMTSEEDVFTTPN